jgi:hypothetical protein
MNNNGASGDIVADLFVLPLLGAQIGTSCLKGRMRIRGWAKHVPGILVAGEDIT